MPREATQDVISATGSVGTTICKEEETGKSLLLLLQPLSFRILCYGSSGFCLAETRKGVSRTP